LKNVFINCSSDSLPEISQKLLQLCGSELIAITDGARGSIIANKQSVSLEFYYV